MNTLTRNIFLFTVGLLLLTLSIEMFKKGQLQIDQPLAFGIAIIVLGIIGGYVITWVAESKNK
jgi:uncharacterized protein (UPF0333 family)